MRRVPVHAVSTRRAAPLLAVAVLGFLGCSYDWTIGAPTPGAGGAGGTGGAGDGGGGSGPQGAGAGGAGGGGDCQALAQALEEARGAARSCTLNAGQCAEKVQDECGCPSYVRESGADADDYVAAVEAFEAAGCTASCTSCLADPGSGTCLFESGMGPYCQP